MAESYISGVRARADAAQRVLSTFKEARNTAVRDLAEIQKQQAAATKRAIATNEHAVDKFEEIDWPESDLPVDGKGSPEYERVQKIIEALAEIEDDLNEMSEVAGDASYELDVSDALSTLGGRIKTLLKHANQVERSAKKAGIAI